MKEIGYSTIGNKVSKSMQKNDFFAIDANFPNLNQQKYGVVEAEERVSAKRFFRRLFK